MEDYVLTEKEFRLFRELIYRITGIALSDAKKQLVLSRLRKRLRHHNLKTFQEYYNLLVAEGDSSPELGELINAITTNKTSFFREPHHFEFIAQEVIPELARNAARGIGGRKLRIWHAGCSTGEEAYTLGMCLSEALEGKGVWDVRQLASDIDTNVLAYADQGIYDAERVRSVPEALLRKYFLRGKGDKEGLYRVREDLRARLTFRQINLLAEEWPFRPTTQFDMIFCRNVVIYFDKPTQKRLFARYARLLKPGGYLFLGHSESMLGISDAVESLGQTIYQLPECSVREARAA
jgi:chemotaxis protein methyltransferase CheR